MIVTKQSIIINQFYISEVGESHIRERNKKNMPESFDERAQSQENKEKEEKVEGLNEVVPPEDLRSAEELVEEAA